MQVQEQSYRIRAYHQGLGGLDNANLAHSLLNMAERETITMSYGTIAVLVEAAARLDGDTYLGWIKVIDDQAATSVPCLTFS